MNLPNNKPILLHLSHKDRKIILLNKSDDDNKGDVNSSPVMTTANAPTIAGNIVSIESLRASQFSELTINKIPSKLSQNCWPNNNVYSLLKPLTLNQNVNQIRSMVPTHKNVDHFQMVNGSISLLKSSQTAVQTSIPLVSAAPSAIDLLTVNNNHANRSLVYREPVTTKDTAPSENCNAATSFVDLTNLESADKPDNSRSEVANDTESSVNLNSEELLLAANVGAAAKNDTLNVTDIKLFTTEKQILQRTYKSRTTTIGYNHIPHIEDVWQEVIELVSNKCHPFTESRCAVYLKMQLSAFWR